MYKYLFVFIVIFTGNLFAQNKVISKERYNTVYDSLTTVKHNLLNEKKILIAEIDSLHSLLEELDGRLRSSRSKQLVRKYGKKIGNRIAQGQVWKGMTEKMLEDSWGKPDKITKNKERWGTFTQWYYGDITYFFKNGEMTDWEEKK